MAFSCVHPFTKRSKLHLFCPIIENHFLFKFENQNLPKIQNISSNAALHFKTLRVLSTNYLS